MGRTKRYRLKKKRERNTSRLPDSHTHHELIKFLATRGWNNMNKLTASTFCTGRGLYAKEDIKENDIIIDLPFKCLISYNTIELDEGFLELFDSAKLNDLKETISFQALLAFYLSYQISIGVQSNWKEYIDTLPKHFSMPYFCKKSELYHLPNYLLEKIVEQNNNIKNNYQHLTSIMRDEFSSSASLDLFKYSYFICNSRSVYINSKCTEPLVDRDLFFKDKLTDEPNMALAPMLDLLNHSDKAITRCQLSHSQGFVESNVKEINEDEIKLSYMLFTSTVYKKYEEIFINYGMYNNTKLLLEYGFILPNNQMDFLEFTLDDINNYIKSHVDLKLLSIPKHKYKFIRDHNLDQQMYIDTVDGLNHNFQAVLAILLLQQNIYNLTQVAFGDELDFDDIRKHAVEIVKNKKISIEEMFCGLKNNAELSDSALKCLEYFCESKNLVDKVLNIIC